MTDKKRVVVIGAGFAGLAAACGLAQDGFEVLVLEKNAELGGRARLWEKEGFVFDLGPSWYWMPDVFEEFFARFGKKPSDFYELVRLDPSYRVYFGKNDLLDLPAALPALRETFERIEPGASRQLDRFLEQAAYKYRVGMGDYVRRPSLSVAEFIDLRLIRESLRLQMVQSMHRHVSAYFRDPRLVQILEFPILFLGGTARKIPAMYSLMNYADSVGGTWYPRGGMARVSQAMAELARSLGVRLQTSAPVRRIEIESGKARRVVTDAETFPSDIVVANGDYHHVEQELIAAEWRDHDEAYWERRVMSPSSLLFYLGVSRRLPNLQHHNLFFDEGLEQHAREIYETPRWPTRPLFYVCCPSQTDPHVAPPGCENLFVLIPVAPGLPDDDATRERYYDLVMERLESLTGQSIREAVIVKRTYAHRDFEEDYHAYKGNAYGLANTLSQTAFFKPALRSRKVRNLFFTGQLTVPGPGVPPALISGQIVSRLITKEQR